MERLLEVLRHRVLRMLEKRGALPEEGPEDARQAYQAQSLQQRFRWTGLDVLRRTFAVDVFSCPRCGGQRRVLAYLTQGAVIRSILRHLHLPEQPPRLAPALGPRRLPYCRVRYAF